MCVYVRDGGGAAGHSKTTSTTDRGPAAADVAAAAKRQELNAAVEDQKALLDSLKGAAHISLDDLCVKCKEPMLVRYPRPPHTHTHTYTRTHTAWPF
jgi:hypothetical protein